MFISRTFWSGAALLAATVAAPAQAQTFPQFHQASQQETARVRDIRISVHGDEFHALFVFTNQPNGAKARISEYGIILSVSGITLEQGEFEPLDIRYIDSVKSAGANGRSEIRVSTPRLLEVGTTLYRRSVMVSGRLADPVSAPRKTAQTPSASHTPNPYQPPKPPHIQTAPVPATLFAIAGLSNAACSQADKAVQHDPWDLEHLADHALCLLGKDDTARAQAVADQLQAFAPDDWKTSLVVGELYFISGDESRAVIAYRTAVALCDDDDARRKLEARLKMLTS